MDREGVQIGIKTVMRLYYFLHALLEFGIFVNCYSLDNQKVEQVCAFQDFKPTCPPGHVILITSALYGRMRVGKCINGDERPACTGDVRDHLDRLCSGRTSCHVTVPNGDLHQRLVCGDSMLSYLEVAYECTPVLTSSRECNSRDMRVIRANQTSGYLSSALATQKAWGSKSCPWVLSVTPGKGIQLSLMDFGDKPRAKSFVVNRNGQQQQAGTNSPAGSSGSQEDSVAFSPSIREDSLSQRTVYASVREKHSHALAPPKESLIFSTGSRDSSVVFSTISSIIEVTLHVGGANASDPVSPQFLLRFEETGCANLDPPSADTHVQRSWSGHESTVRVICNFSSVESELVCDSSQWRGDIKNCSAPDVSLSQNAADRSFISTVGVAISVVLGLIVGVVCGSIVLGLIILWKSRQNQRERMRANLRGAGGYSSNSSQMFQVACNGDTDSSIVTSSDRPTFVELVDSNGVPIAVYRSMRKANNGSALMTLEHVYESPRFDALTGEAVRRAAPPLPRSASLGRNIPNQILAGSGHGTLPRMGVATRVAMPPANHNHDLCRDCQAMASVSVPLRPNERLEIPSDAETSPMTPSKHNHVLKTFKIAKEIQTNDSRESNENHYS